MSVNAVKFIVIIFVENNCNENVLCGTRNKSSEFEFTWVQILDTSK